MPCPSFDLIEIEGDAAFLSLQADTLDSDATVALTLQAAMAMHRAFHLERHYVATNLCPCDGCTQANNLKLKFVAHIGEVATQTIRQRRKLVGIDVILVHRMLKNPVEVPEYVLLSEELYRTSDAADAWSRARGRLRTSRGSGRFWRTSWTSRTSRVQSLRRRVHRYSDASGGPWPSPAPACRTCWACAADVEPPPLSDRCRVGGTTLPTAAIDRGRAPGLLHGSAAETLQL